MVSFPACAQHDRLTVSEARLIDHLVDGRSGSPRGAVNAPAGSAFLWVRLQVPDSVPLPLGIELVKAEASDTTNQRFKLLGFSPFNEADPVLRIILGPVSRGGSQVADVTDLVTGHGDTRDYDVDITGAVEKHSAKLTIKSRPTMFSVYFVVPARAGSFQIHALTEKPLATATVALPVQK